MANNGASHSSQFTTHDSRFKDITGPKPVIQQSLQSGYIVDGDAWARMLESRNLTSHTYNEETAREIASAIKEEYVGLFSELRSRLVREN